MIIESKLNIENIIFYLWTTFGILMLFWLYPGLLDNTSFVLLFYKKDHYLEKYDKPTIASFTEVYIGIFETSLLILVIIKVIDCLVDCKLF